MPNFISVKRAASSETKAIFDEARPEIEPEIPVWSEVVFRKVGSLGLQYITVGEHGNALNRTGSSLGQLDSEEVAEIIRHGINETSSASDQIEVPVLDIAFLGKREPVHIVVRLGSAKVRAERQKLTQILDQVSGINIGWRGFQPHIKLGTSERLTDSVLEPFKELMPSVVKLEPISVSVTSLNL